MYSLSRLTSRYVSSAADGLGVQQRWQFGEVDEPVGVPGGPVVVGTIDDPEHAMVSFADLMEQVADLLGGGGCHLVPLVEDVACYAPGVKPSPKVLPVWLKTRK